MQLALQNAPTSTRKEEYVTNICALVMNTARARYFVLREAELPTVQGGPELVPHHEVENPEATVPERGLFANLPGTNRSGTGVAEHNYDDHRAQHVQEITTRFARSSIAQAERLVREESADVLVIAANPSMLGTLRPLLASANGLSGKVLECPKDLARHSARAIQEALASEGLVPQRQDPSHTRNGKRR